MELGLALSGYKEVIESAYDLPVLSKAADFMSTMTYDYHGGWETKVGHHTPLQPNPNDPLPNYSIVSTKYYCLLLFSDFHIFLFIYKYLYNFLF